MMDTLIKIDNVSLSFGDKVILKPISIEVKDIVRPGMIQGQIIGLIGRSGIGKSTLAKILTGLMRPSTGSIYVGNKKIEAGTVGYVAQNYPLFNNRTVMGNLLVSLERSNISKLAMKDRVKEYLIRFNLQNAADLYPCSLSGGMKQRVAIIQQLLSSEHYLVMDEPFSGQDFMVKEEVCKLITSVANLHEENTIFVIAHDIESLVNISDHLWLLGQDKDENGNNIPGAYIKKEYNLIERGICWNEKPELSLFIEEIKQELRMI